ncbi:VaFE repeat-containing surface-anchored protein [Jonesiaceae bacterium BS-20]|uniref:VaFE repeat-containing surface-anchored protein n=1 Tax=Jonesiaceae bacterium BS-20 TaxID=3120821 RepID=A0AAU7DT14_9MICO
MRKRLNRLIAVISAAFVSAAGIGISALPAQAADGPNGEVRGFLWPGGNGIPNWEGTYRMPDTGEEAWCASVWQPEPKYGTQWSSPTLLKNNQGGDLTPDKMQELAYIISYASDLVLGEVGHNADTHAAAVSVIVHHWTNAKGIAFYDPNMALTHFDLGRDPVGTGQDPRQVRPVYDKLIADAAQYRGEWAITLTSDISEVKIGETATVTGALKRASDSRAISNHAVDLSVTGGTLSSTRVTTNAQGEFSAIVTVTDAEATVTASRISPATTVQMKEPLKWSGNKPQNMILVSKNKVSASVDFTGTSIELGTSATDQADGDKILHWNGGTIVDVVSYKGLEPGQEYTVTGELMDKATAQGTGITGSKTFTPTTADGTVEVTFTVPAGHDGKTLVVFEKLYDAEGEFVASHEDIEDEDQTVVVEEAPTLGTSATDQADGDKILHWNGGTIVDVVAYTNLDVGKEYTVKGELMDKATGEGTGILGETIFTPEERDGTVNVEFTVPAGFAGDTLVVFEKLYDVNGKIVATHEDIEDEDQTVVVEEAPTLGTSAYDQSDEDKFIAWDGGVVIDQVRYTNLDVGKEYTVKGELMDKATGEGTGILGETIFTPEERDGTVNVEFTVPAGFAGDTLVVFEKLYDVNGKIVATHEDIEDEDQTVVVEDAPTLGTKATDQADGDKFLHWTGGTITDQVTYTGLIIGDEYTVTGELMDKATGEGTGILGETTFTAEERDGTIAVEFIVPEGFAGDTLVVFEKLYNVDGKIVASHEDIEDEDQTVVVEDAPTLGTSATDQADGDKIIPWDGGVVIDQVRYTNLDVGTEYTVKGELMDKETGEGTGVFGETTFTAEERDGTIAVEFVIPEGFAGDTLVVFEKLYDVNGKIVATHEDIEDEDQTVVVEDAPTLGTKATDQADGDKFLHWTGGTITDQVTYTGLIIGDEYTVTGELMDKATGEGTGILGETTFTAEERDGTIAVEFIVPEGFAGDTLVVFEKLYNVDGKIVASHEDIEDEEQTVKVNEQPTLKTKASDQADGDKVIAWNGGTVVDHVTYTGLTIGQKYTVTGELMDKATGKGTGIKGQTTFTAESVDGTVKVTFKVPKGYAGKTLVAFERLYDAGGVLQAVHEDINDKEQTVTVEKQPVGPDLAKTGADDALFYALGAATLLGLGGALQLTRNRRLKA